MKKQRASGVLIALKPWKPTHTLKYDRGVAVPVKIFAVSIDGAVFQVDGEILSDTDMIERILPRKLRPAKKPGSQQPFRGL